MEFLEQYKNDLCNINDENTNKDITEDTIDNKVTKLGPGDAPPPYAGVREVQVEDLEASLHKCPGGGCDLVLLGIIFTNACTWFRGGHDPLFT